MLLLTVSFSRVESPWPNTVASSYGHMHDWSSIFRSVGVTHFHSVGTLKSILESFTWNLSWVRYLNDLLPSLSIKRSLFLFLLYLFTFSSSSYTVIIIRRILINLGDFSFFALFFPWSSCWLSLVRYIVSSGCCLQFLYFCCCNLKKRILILSLIFLSLVLLASLWLWLSLSYSGPHLWLPLLIWPPQCCFQSLTFPNRSPHCLLSNATTMVTWYVSWKWIDSLKGSHMNCFCSALGEWIGDNGKYSRDSNFGSLLFYASIKPHYVSTIFYNQDYFPCLVPNLVCQRYFY